MHVRNAVLVAVALTLACDARPERAKRVVPPGLARTSAASATPSFDPAFLPLARAARDAATKVASECQLRSEGEDLFNRYTDYCMLTTANVAALRTSAAALAALPAPTDGAALLFAEEVRLFTAWVDLVTPGVTPGTLSHYQGLASAWNALQPGSRIPVDIRTKERGSETVVVGGEGGKLVWVRCSTGPCVVVPRKAY